MAGILNDQERIFGGAGQEGMILTGFDESMREEDEHEGRRDVATIIPAEAKAAFAFGGIPSAFFFNIEEEDGSQIHVYFRCVRTFVYVGLLMETFVFLSSFAPFFCSHILLRLPILRPANYLIDLCIFTLVSFTVCSTAEQIIAPFSYSHHLLAYRGDKHNQLYRYNKHFFSSLFFALCFLLLLIAKIRGSLWLYIAQAYPSQGQQPLNPINRIINTLFEI